MLHELNLRLLMFCKVNAVNICVEGEEREGFTNFSRRGTVERHFETYMNHIAR